MESTSLCVCRGQAHPACLSPGSARLLPLASCSASRTACRGKAMTEPVEHIRLLGLAETPERACVATEVKDGQGLVVLVRVDRYLGAVFIEPDARWMIDALAANVREVGAPEQRRRRHFHGRHIL